MSTFDSFNPVTGLSIGQHAISSQEDVDAAVASAREVAPFWQALGFKGRKKALLQWNTYLLK
jgi:aldehyde dehydrogenase (NAD+)